MSDFRAMAGVSSTLKRLLEDQMEEPVPVTIAPPDVLASEVPGNRVNLFLYQVTENGYLKNQEILGQGHPGAYGCPPLSLELHYLLTAFASNETADLQAQQILGDAMRVLHDFAIITPALHMNGDPAEVLILDSSLIGEFERLKITLQPLNLEDFSKIWMAMPQTNFRRSVAYQVSVVQIESRRTRRLAMPVKTRRIHVAMPRRPEITTVYRTPVSANEPIGDPRVKLGQAITIEGTNFVAAKTWVQIEDLEPIRVTPLSNEKIQINLPDEEYPADADHSSPRPIPAELRLWPGARRVEVLTEQATEAVEGGLGHGVVVADSKVLRSNQGVFILVPEITSADPNNATIAALPTAILTVDGKRLFRQELKSFVLVGDVAIEVRAPDQLGNWAEPNETSVQVPLATLSPALPPITLNDPPYAVRIMVNGAQSLEEGIGFWLLP